LAVFIKSENNFKEINKMDKKSQELRQEKAETLKRMKAILDKVENEKRVMNQEEKKDYEEMDKRIDQLNTEISGHEGIILKRASVIAELAEGEKIYEPIEQWGSNKIVTSLPGREKRAREIKGFIKREDELPEEDFWKCLASRDFGPLKNYRIENRTGFHITTGATGGFAIPEVTRLAVIDNLLADQGIFSRIGKEFVEGGDTLNVATFENCNIDSDGLYGFSIPEFISEGGTISDQTPKLVKRMWTLKKMVMGSRISLEAMVTGNFGASMQQALTNVLRYGLEKYIVTGTGAAQPQGLINASCGVTVARAGAGAIAFADTYNMLAQTRLSGDCVWIGSQTIIPQLAKMVDAGNHAIWLGNGAFNGATGGIPTTLLGYPIIFTLGINPVLGTKGDLLFCSDFSFYKAVIFQDIIVQTSDSAYWTTGEIGLRPIMFLDMGVLPQDVITIGGSSFGWFTILSA